MMDGRLQRKVLQKLAQLGAIYAATHAAPRREVGRGVSGAISERRGSSAWPSSRPFTRPGKTCCCRDAWDTSHLEESARDTCRMKSIVACEMAPVRCPGARSERSRRGADAG